MSISKIIFFDLYLDIILKDVRIILKYFREKLENLFLNVNIENNYRFSITII